MSYQTLTLDIRGGVAQVRFSRPEKANALSRTGWDELRQVFGEISRQDEARVAVLSGEGKHFSSGIDLALLMEAGQISGNGCEGRKREQLRAFILHLQSCIDAIAQCRKPVIAAIHGGCIGGAVDIVAACDMRYCTEDAYFCIKEIDMGMVADLGTLQRLPKLIPDGMAREMAYTGRKVFGPEALRVGLVNRTYPDAAALMEGTGEIAALIASKSPLSIRGTKEMLNYTRDHSVADSLNYMAAWNAGMLISEDLAAAFQASLTKREAVFLD
jgi:enoyl-CoA hydratase